MNEAEARRRRKLILKIRRRRILLLAACVLLLTAAAAAVVIFAFKFPVERLEITENTVYDEEQIRCVADINFGRDSLLLFDTDKLAQKLESALPYIGDAKVGRRLPNIVTIDAVKTEAAAIVASGTDDGSRVLINSEGKVLERLGAAASPEGLPTLRVGGASFATPGDDISFDPKQTLRLFTSITDCAAELGLEGLTVINLTDAADIRVTYMDRIVLLLGSESDLEYKLSIAAESLKREDEINPNQHGELNLKTDGTASLRPSN